MHLRTKKIAFLSIMAAFSIILMYLGCVIETSTLFFIAAASFLVGVAVREHGFSAGAVFFAVCLLLSFFLLPNKLYCITYTAFGLYIWFGDFCVLKWNERHEKKLGRFPYFFMKLFIFNVLFIPVLVAFPQLLIGKELDTKWIVLTALAAQPALIVFDYAYVWFHNHVWRKR